MNKYNKTQTKGEDLPSLKPNKTSDDTRTTDLVKVCVLPPRYTTYFLTWSLEVDPIKKKTAFV